MRTAEPPAHAKPLLRGVSHEIAAFVSFAAWMTLLAAASGPTARASRSAK